jgi:uncharacterized protein (DUF58 family)
LIKNFTVFLLKYYKKILIRKRNKNMADKASELLKKVRKIEIKTRGLSREIFAGEYHTAFKGRGMTFSEVREYQYGDDIRNIDWNVTARFGSPFVKIFEEEREMTVVLLIDLSTSGKFGTRIKSKRELITEVAATLSFSAIQNNDKVGVIFFTDKIEKFIPPKKGRSHILHIIRELLNFEPQNKGTNLTEGLKYFTNVIKKRCTAFLISDFIDKNYEKALQIASYKHDLIALNIKDNTEIELPDSGFLKFKDAETDRYVWIDTSDSNVRKTFKKQKLKEKEQLELLLKKLGINFAELITDKDYVKPLIQMFKSR